MVYNDITFLLNLYKEDIMDLEGTTTIKQQIPRFEEQKTREDSSDAKGLLTACFEVVKASEINRLERNIEARNLKSQERARESEESAQQHAANKAKLERIQAAKARLLAQQNRS